MKLIDESTEFGRRAARRLREESVIWLTTVSASLAPQPRPVWFLWDGEKFMIYSQPQGHKVAHIARHPQVALHFNGDAHGGDIIVFTGEAHIATEPPPADLAAAYLDKYREGIAELGMSETQMTGEYSAAIFVTPKAVRGF